MATLVQSGKAAVVPTLRDEAHRCEPAKTAPNAPRPSYNYTLRIQNMARDLHPQGKRETRITILDTSEFKFKNTGIVINPKSPTYLFSQ
jgi:hypothetical protein